MTESLGKSDLERYRLPVKFDGGYIIHPVSDDLTTVGQENEVEERWIQKHQIGKGGFGEVWLQEEEGGGELRAVKRLVRVVQGVDFSRELVTLATLVDHKRLFVQFYGWYEDIARNFVFLAMEYIDGGDLGQYLKDPIIRTEAKEITKQLLRGLAIMHERHICHRDIKPQNVLVVSLKPMWIKLADFGVSKVEKDTYLRTTVGTLAYSAPELFGLLPRRLKPLDVYTNAVDMWSLGCLVHEMLTTERPFLEQVREDDPETTSVFDTVGSEAQADIDMIIEFCRDERGFPGQALQKSGASASETSFVKGLLRPDPCRRLSAVNALASPWISEVAQSGSVNAPPTAMLGSSQRLKRFSSKNALGMFFPEIDAELTHQAELFALELVKRGCPRGIAASLEVLVLYDLALLISDSESMVDDQGGQRIKILQRLLNAIASVYNLARERGISTVRFFNALQGKKNITAQTVKTVIKGHQYGGDTRIGTELERKIIDKFVIGIEMKKPLLVIVITDQAVEGESISHLDDVLESCLRETSMDSGGKGPHSTAFQFLRIGNNDTGVETLQRMTGTYEQRGHVNFRRVLEFDHDCDSDGYWIEITHILLGAITENWK